MKQQTIRVRGLKTGETMRARMRPQPPKGLVWHPSALTFDDRHHYLWKGNGQLWGTTLPVFSGVYPGLFQVRVERPELAPDGWYWVYVVEWAKGGGS